MDRKEMKTEIRERRIFMMEEYGRSLSEKEAIEATAKKFKVNKGSLYTDWSRRENWLNEIVDLKDSSNMIRQLVFEIYRSLQGITKLSENADNDNCKLGALKLRIKVLFKLVDLYRTYDNEELRQRVEQLEEIVEERKSNDC